METPQLYWRLVVSLSARWLPGCTVKQSWETDVFSWRPASPCVIIIIRTKKTCKLKLLTCFLCHTVIILALYKAFGKWYAVGRDDAKHSEAFNYSIRRFPA